MYTPIGDQDYKLDIIDHLNLDHTNEIVSIAQALTDCSSATHASLNNLFEEGVELLIATDNGNQKKVFIPFQTQGDIEEKLIYLAYSAMVKQGKILNDNRRQFFEVLAIQTLTPNFVRLSVRSDTPLPKNSPAYAYGFLLKSLKKQFSHKPTKKPTSKSLWQHTVDITLLWVIKKLSSKRRQKMMRNMNKDIRYYTLQSTWKSSPDIPDDDCGYIDIFLHGDTEGSLWAKSLKIGDIITSRVEIDDKHSNIHQGTPLLIADETAYPALLGILQQWQNPIAPTLIILSENDSEQHYFNAKNLPPDVQIHRIICSPKEQSERIIETIQKLPSFTTAWGAFEKESTKKVRAYLRNHLMITGNDNRIKAYWAL